MYLDSLGFIYNQSGYYWFISSMFHLGYSNTDGSNAFCTSMVYDSPNLLCHFSKTIQHPWIVVDDFNAYLHHSEKSGGANPNHMFLSKVWFKILGDMLMGGLKQLVSSMRMLIFGTKLALAICSIRRDEFLLDFKTWEKIDTCNTCKIIFGKNHNTIFYDTSTIVLRKRNKIEVLLDQRGKYSPWQLNNRFPIIEEGALKEVEKPFFDDEI
ncbi:hypothetical protein CR513_27864, partial [Mucuna pruriens]